MVIKSSNKQSLCYLCKNSQYLISYAQVDHFELTKCSSCGFVFTDGIDQQKIEELYKEEDYYSQKGGSGFAIDGYLHDGRKDDLFTYYLKNRIMPIQKRMELPTNPRYLDIGCSAGLMLKIGQELGWDCFGQEISPVALRYAKESLKLNVTDAPLEDFIKKEKKFDVISAFHILEHLVDPKNTLSQIHNLLDDNGILAIEVPNIRSLPAIMRKRSWHGYVLPYHLWHFSLQTVTKLLKDSGLQVIYYKYPFMPCTSSHILNIHRFIASFFSFKKNQYDVNNTSTIATNKKNTKSLLKKHLVHLMYFPFDLLIYMLGMGETVYLLAKKSSSKDSN